MGDSADREQVGTGEDEGGEGAAGTARMDEREAVANDEDDLFPRDDDEDDDGDDDGDDGDDGDGGRDA